MSMHIVAQVSLQVHTYSHSISGVWGVVTLIPSKWSNNPILACPPSGAVVKQELPVTLAATATAERGPPGSSATENGMYDNW